MEPPLVLIYKKTAIPAGLPNVSQLKQTKAQSIIFIIPCKRERATASRLLLLFILFSKSRCCRPRLLPNTTPRSSTLIIQTKTHSFLHNSPGEDTTSRQPITRLLIENNNNNNNKATEIPQEYENTPSDNVMETVQQYWPEARFHTCGRNHFHCVGIWS